MRSKCREIFRRLSETRLEPAREISIVGKADRIGDILHRHLFFFQQLARLVQPIVDQQVARILARQRFHLPIKGYAGCAKVGRHLFYTIVRIGVISLNISNHTLEIRVYRNPVFHLFDLTWQVYNPVGRCFIFRPYKLL